MRWLLSMAVVGTMRTASREPALISRRNPAGQQSNNRAVF
jgi:hypothetical protein